MSLQGSAAPAAPTPHPADRSDTLPPPADKTPFFTCCAPAARGATCPATAFRHARRSTPTSSCSRRTACRCCKWRDAPVRAGRRCGAGRNATPKPGWTAAARQNPAARQEAGADRDCRPGAGADPERAVRRGDPFGPAEPWPRRSACRCAPWRMPTQTDRQHHGMRRRVHVEADDVFDLLGESRIIGPFEGADAMWLKAVRFPDALASGSHDLSGQR